MNISHHFDTATLVAYAGGTLPPGMSLLVACHLHWCESCRTAARQADALGGALLERLDPAPLAQGALDHVLAQLDSSEPQPDSNTDRDVLTEPSGTKSGKPDALPAPLASLLGQPLEALNWRRLGYGVQQYDLGLAGPGATRLLRIAPGVAVPHHSHRGNELTLILKGSYADELGRFQLGDVADVDCDVSHQPIVDTDQECICLIATDAPLRFTGLMGRLIQPFVRL